MLSTTRLTSIAVTLFALAMVPGLTLPLAAHEIGTTRVSLIALDHARFDIEVATDASSLLEKLETIAGEVPSGTRDPAALQHRLNTLSAIFQQRVNVSFDGARVQPALAWTVSTPGTAAPGAMATIRLSGDVPAGAQALTWRYSWTFTAYPLLDRRTHPAAATEWLDGDRASTPLLLQTATPPESRFALLNRYIALGFTHILPKGLDHVLFVLGIFLVSRRVRPILLQVTAFTVAHSITLALGIRGVVSVPPAIVEPAIALSITYIALENVVMKDLRPWRYAMVFAFGLLHGLGFAGVLRKVGLPPSEFVTALLGFNLGVELGQLTVIGAAFLLVGFWFRDRTWYRARVVLPVSMVIACAGLYWTIQRLNVIA